MTSSTDPERAPANPTSRWAKLVEPNMANDERFVRVLVGACLIMLAVVVRFAWGWTGIYLVLTGLAGSCPIYRGLGVQRHHDHDDD